jgi:hypothetical protein
MNTLQPTNKTMSNGSVERGVEWVSTHFGGAMGVLKKC